MAQDFEIRLLGPVELSAGGQRLDLGPRKQRLVLAVLALEPHRVVQVERLIELLWPETPPPSARGAIQVSVSRLRGVLTDAGVPTGEVGIAGQPGGYLLRVDPDRVDAHRFRGLLDQAGAAPDADAVPLLRQALALWRGEPLLGTGPPAVRWRLGHGLAEARLGALERCLDAELRLGRHRQVLDELVALVEEHPDREPFTAQLMLALYRSGQSSRALEVYRGTRRRLIEEFGVEPGADLQELHEAVLRTSSALDLPATGAGGSFVPPPPRQLPADSPSFVGREAELAELDEVLAGTGSRPPAAVITGSAGVGKTALAVHWAHANRSRFPDGQLYLNLRGHSADPALAPAEALSRLLRALGTPADAIPLDQGEQEGLYRSLLADRRVLVLLDNAERPGQVRPLLAGSPTCALLVTSRNDLRGLTAVGDAHRQTLGVLPEPEALALLGHLLGTERVAAEPAAAAELVRLCARLPLALRIAAAQLTRTSPPDGTVAAYTAELRDGNRLAALEVHGDEQAAVRAAFALSYATLPEQPQRLFRLLGLVPGPDVTAAAAAALAGSTAPQVTRWLDQLAAAHLVDRHEPGRFGFHDLLRLYAAERAGQDDAGAERRAALRRLFDHYLRGLDAAARLLYPHVLRLPMPASTDPGTADPGTADPAGDAGAATPGGRFADYREASDWLDRERPNLVAAVAAAAAHGPPAAAWLIADALRGYFWLRGDVPGWLQTARHGLAAAEAAGDRRAQATAYLSRAALDSRQDRPRETIEGYQRALALARETGWVEAEAAALGNLGSVYADLGELGRAGEHCTAALELNRRVGLIEGEAVNLAHLGWLGAALGRLPEAAEHYQEALALDRKTGSRSGEATDLTNLGEIYHELGRLDAAVDCLAQAVALHRAIGDRGAEADALASLAAVHADGGCRAEALRLARTALAAARGCGFPEFEVSALNVLGVICTAEGGYREAAALHAEALQVAPGSLRRRSVRALVGLAAARRGLGELAAARADAEHALDQARCNGYRADEGRALSCLAEIQLAAGDAATAVRTAEQALAVHAETGHRLGAARTHLVLGHARLAGDPAGGRDAAERAWRAALAQFTAVGAVAADEVAALLDRPPIGTGPSRG